MKDVLFKTLLKDLQISLYHPAEGIMQDFGPAEIHRRWKIHFLKFLRGDNWSQQIQY